MDIVLVETKQQLKDAYAVRMKVFVEEQGVPQEIEIDGFEDQATHFVVYDKEVPIGAGRFRRLDEIGKVERICILDDFRKTGAGKRLMEKIEEVMKQQGLKKAKLNAQTHAESFYKRIGYTTVSELFYEANIPHVTMEKIL
ncbi:MAG TPA: GNAT family N-acetyltransferase [Bacilli bacterium]|nr:GNAT family N-acetyltransferase [Bacilli bacterium]